MRDYDFAYAVGRLRVLETKLLNANDLERLAEQASLTEALAALGETEYGPDLMALAEPEEFEQALDSELERTNKLLLQLAQGRPEFNLFLFHYDLENLKLLLKSDFLEPDALSRLGHWDPEWLVHRFRENDLDQLPPFFCQLIEQGRTVLNQTDDPREVDRVLDRAWLNYGWELLKASSSQLLYQWWIGLIDLTNLRTFVRMRLLELPYTEFQSFFITNGYLKLNDFNGFWDKPPAQVGAWLANSPYPKLAGEGGALLNSLTGLERAGDNLLLDLIMPAKWLPLGIEPLVGYLLAKENEVKILRIILVGKANQLTIPDIKERLRDAYV